MAASSGTVDEELLKVELVALDAEIGENEHQIQLLVERQEQLKFQRELLEDKIKRKEAEKVLSQNFDSEEFEWSKKLRSVLQSVFNISQLRPYQLPTMNAALSGHDCILIMPTGGGKSLCFQLPSLLTNGRTLVVSPLVALMEDQVMALKERRVPVAMFSASTSVKEQNQILKDMVTPNSSLKIVYATPEKLAKSKRLMAAIQKAYQTDQLTLLAIDEVHCCSQWGHDFRPDYKLLGVIKRQFPKLPIMGLTATATSRVTGDVQKMLGIENCLVFRASFNRPNLVYKVRAKPTAQTEVVDDIADLILRRYTGQSGIVYCLSIKEAEEVASELRSRGVKARPYHAQMEAEHRSRVHRGWIANTCQVVVATIAFGMGIDKPDVRFVLHHSLSKSVENYYQESGRAGRDDKPADCVLFFRLNDVFRLSTMIFSETTGLTNLYAILAYCIDQKRCRRSILSDHFGEEYTSADCNKSCDNCNPALSSSGPTHTTKVDVTSHCLNLYKIIDHAEALEQRLTGLKLIDAWLRKGAAVLRLDNVPNPGLSREGCERVIARLLVDGYLKEEFHYTAYSTISYITAGRRSSSVLRGDHVIEIDMVRVGTNSMRPSASAQESDGEKSKATKGQCSKDSSSVKTSRKPQKVIESSSKPKKPSKRSPSAILSSSSSKGTPKRLTNPSVAEHVARDNGSDIEFLEQIVSSVKGKGDRIQNGDCELPSKRVKV